MNILQKLYNKFGKDKVFHFTACFGIALITGLILLPFANVYVTLFASFMASSGAALGKEYGDKCSPSNRWDWNDVIADYLGTFSALIMILIIYMI